MDRLSAFLLTFSHLMTASLHLHKQPMKRKCLFTKNLIDALIDFETTILEKMINTNMVAKIIDAPKSQPTVRKNINTYQTDANKTFLAKIDYIFTSCSYIICMTHYTDKHT